MFLWVDVLFGTYNLRGSVMYGVELSRWVSMHCAETHPSGPELESML